ncbi:Sugar transporter/spinster transmembrane protein [Handroanthus impetiginosus]|uniref:Sugar transporter/spinster transmembrane protein n=1 Tax=Handroanthus impetiginosus TaxID=429701 RepID=A0A2G9GAT0_9LAMI|nr:Sugar transporter/spinster transmembrane protein [Handroanthus impetiginosus]
MKAETLTLVLVNLAGIMERADESLLPAVYKEVGEALHAGPTGLGLLTLFRSMVQAICYPLAAYLAARHNRALVIAYGAFLWAAATFLVAFASTFFEVAVSRALNGIGLAIVAPAIQSLVADSTNDSSRGVAFGWLQLTSNFGSIIGGLLSLLIAPLTFMGIPGWRISFHLVGIISVAVGILVRLFATDPHFPYGGVSISNEVPRSSLRSDFKDLIQEAHSVIKIPSFQIIVAQGVTGSFPWSALSFAPMWLELTGFSHKKTAILIGIFVVANSLGGLFGGKMGDFLSKRLPNSGRIILSQISSGSAIPLAAILLLVVPNNPSTMFLHGLVLFITGFCISWNAAATNNPIFAEIVPEKSRTSIYALDRSFESVLSSFAPPTVGLLAQYVYGYKPVSQGSENISTDRDNAKSLAKALFVAMAIPMALCCIIYSFLYLTYPRDRERARMEAIIESEMQLIESPSTGMQSTERKELNLDGRTIIELPFDDDDDDDDESDEKTLIRRPDL